MAIITELIEKKGKDEMFIANWRLISPMNVGVNSDPEGDADWKIVLNFFLLQPVGAHTS